MSTAVKIIFVVVLLTKTNNRPIIGWCRLSNGWYRLSADNRCTSIFYSNQLTLFSTSRWREAGWKHDSYAWKLVSIDRYITRRLCYRNASIAKYKRKEAKSNFCTDCDSGTAGGWGAQEGTVVQKRLRTVVAVVLCEDPCRVLLVENTRFLTDVSCSV